MSASNCTAFPVKAQAFRFYGTLYNATTGLPITGGLTAIAGTKSLDGAAFSALTNVPVESPANSGSFYVDLTVAEMTANSILVAVTATNPNAFTPVTPITPLQLAEQAGAALDQAIILFEQVVLDIMACCINPVDFDGQNSSNNQQIYERGNTSALKLQGTYSPTDSSSTRSRLA